MRIRVVWSLSALCEALRRLGFTKLDRPASRWVQYKKVGWHVLIEWQRSSHPLNPPFYIEVLLHFDKPQRLYANAVFPNVTLKENIQYGPDVDLMFSMISLMYSRVLLDWAEEEPSIKEHALLRASREGLDTEGFIDERL